MSKKEKAWDATLVCKNLMKILRIFLVSDRLALVSVLWLSVKQVRFEHHPLINIVLKKIVKQPTCLTFQGHPGTVYP